LGPSREALVLELGDLRVEVLSDGFQRLDGGAMFGIVPKPLWERRIPPDERNRIRLALRCLLVWTPSGPALVDTGIGPKEEVRDPRFCDIYGVEREGGLLAELAARGLEPGEVRWVINTHLHFDHCGGNTRLGEGGEVVPTFPNARYVVVRGEWEDALSPNERNRASYRPDNFLPLGGAGLLELVEPDAEIVPGVRFVHAPGHTRFHQCVRMEGSDEVALFCADLVPTVSHVAYPYIMAYDLCPLDTLATKKRLLPLAAREGWHVILQHEPGAPVGRLVAGERGGVAWRPDSPEKLGSGPNRARASGTDCGVI
jgi:glyoxylase-like metal-dependent hydrolase (beta-lactamase superfamily II)